MTRTRAVGAERPATRPSRGKAPRPGDMVLLRTASHGILPAVVVRSYEWDTRTFAEPDSPPRYELRVDLVAFESGGSGCLIFRNIPRDEYEPKRG